MAQVNVTIAGKVYRMACDDGQEAHLEALAERLNATIDQLRGSFGEIGDQRLTVMAAITMGDELAEANRRIRRLEAELKSVNDHEARLARSLDNTAERIEGLTRTLVSGRRPATERN